MSRHAPQPSALWPLAPALFPNEAISSWLDRCAAAHGLDRRDVIGATADACNLRRPGAGLDWDLAPDTRMLAVLERNSGLTPGSLLSRRMPHAAGVLRPAARRSYCPLCYAALMRRGIVPPTPAEWHLAFVTQCRVHGLPFFTWPGNMYTRDGDRQFHLGIDWEPRPAKRRAELRISLRNFSLGGKSLMTDLHLARELFSGQLRMSAFTRRLWQRQVAFQEMLLSHWRGTQATPHRILGDGLQAVTAVSDMISMIISPFGPPDEWPRILNLQHMFWGSDMAYFTRWKPTYSGMLGAGPTAIRHIEDEPIAARRSMALGLVESVVSALASAPPVEDEMENRRHQARLEVLAETVEMLPGQAREYFLRRSQSWSENLRCSLDIPVSRELEPWPRRRIMGLRENKPRDQESLAYRKGRFMKLLHEKFGRGNLKQPSSDGKA